MAMAGLHYGLYFKGCGKGHDHGLYFKGCGKGHEVGHAQHTPCSQLRGTGTDQTENISIKMAPMPVDQETLAGSHLSSLGAGPQFLHTQHTGTDRTSY